MKPFASITHRTYRDDWQFLTRLDVFGDDNVQVKAYVLPPVNDGTNNEREHSQSSSNVDGFGASKIPK